MTYAHVVDVAAPVELYDAMHAEIVRQSTGTVDGLLVHLGHPTAGGFRVVEVWQSKRHFERYNDETVLPVLQRMAAGQPGPPPASSVEEIDVHGLIVAGDSSSPLPPAMMEPPPSAAGRAGGGDDGRPGR